MKSKLLHYLLLVTILIALSTLRLDVAIVAAFMIFVMQRRRVVVW